MTTFSNVKHSYDALKIIGTFMETYRLIYTYIQLPIYTHTYIHITKMAETEII